MNSHSEQRNMALPSPIDRLTLGPPTCLAKACMSTLTKAKQFKVLAYGRAKESPLGGSRSEAFDG